MGRGDAKRGEIRSLALMAAKGSESGMSAARRDSSCGGFFLGLVLLQMAFALSVCGLRAETKLDEESPWPRTRTSGTNTVILYQPQVERWTSNWFRARAAVEVKTGQGKAGMMGVIWFEAHGRVDRETRIVKLDGLQITNGRFPEATDGGSNALAVVRSVLPSVPCTVSLDYLVTALGFAQAAARQGPKGLKHEPPEIIWVTNRTVLVIVDGAPKWRPVPDRNLQRVINTPALIVKEGGTIYLSGDGVWFAASSLDGPWSLAQSPPPDVAALTQGTNAMAGPDTVLPRIVVRTRPAELVATKGLPDFRLIEGTMLMYAANTDTQLFYDTANREAYLLLSGRWFKAKSLEGPWEYVPPRELPGDFAKIPPGSAQAVVLASVPDTAPAQLAVLANSVPTTATVSRSKATIQLSYKGEPKFKPIDGTKMSYAVNAQLPVVQLGNKYYAVDNGVWFVGGSPTGPWSVATEVPEDIYSIPPSSPVYYATAVQVYDSNDDEVDVGYSPGYLGAYEDDGTVVYGTGWDYDPWDEEEYYGWGWTYGYGYVYVPWWQWWVWRNWWDHPGALRSAVMENVYDRWQGRNGIVHYDRPANAPKLPVGNYRGYPALYGRFEGTTRPVAMTPPANTLAVNPYARPTQAWQAGDIPRGAQLLSSLQKSPGGGRDLYASTDGRVYMRKDDGWYQRGAAGKWDYVAPAQGKISTQRPGTGREGQVAGGAGGGTVFRAAAAGDGFSGGRAQALADRVPDMGSQVQAQQIVDMEREYFARSIAHARAQNWGGYRGGGRRFGGRR